MLDVRTRRAGEKGNLLGPGESDVGAALALVLVASALLAAMGTMMLALADVETSGTGSHRDGVEAFYAADALLEAVIDELTPLADWSPVLAGTIPSRFRDATGRPLARFAGQLDMARLTADLQAESDSVAGWASNNPRWRLFSWGHLSLLWPSAGPAGGVYLAAWVSDDVAETDGDPLVDSNDTVRVRAEAHGRRGSLRRIEGVITRTGTPGVARQTSWREVS